jgi:hypothetical protein
LRELTEYLEWLNERVELIVVDGSDEEDFALHAAKWCGIRHVAPLPRFQCANGKVWGVLTGFASASNDYVVIADDDVRYDDRALEQVIAALERAEVVRPQNYFRPLPWHACWDTARSLINRVTGGDWPGTLALRLSTLGNSPRYDGDCLFENLELVRTVKAAGGRELDARDIYVKRLPSTAGHFLSQRVRQAYDELARPRRMCVQLALLPLGLFVTIEKPVLLLIALAGVITTAEAGRRRDGGAQVFPLSASLMAPLWVLERSVCAWLALGSRVFFGGMRYSGGRLLKAATPEDELGQRSTAKMQTFESRTVASASASLRPAITGGTQ